MLKITILSSLFFLAALFPSASFATDYVGSDNPKDEDFRLVPCNGVNCDFNALMKLVNRVISFILYVSIPLAAISFSYAGYLYLSAAGDTGKIESAHEIFKKVLIGFIFILSAWLIVYAITNSLLSSDFKNSEGNLLRNGGIGSGSGDGNSGGEYSGDNGSGNGTNDTENASENGNIDLQVVDENNFDSINPDLYAPPTDYDIEKYGF